MWEAKKIIFVFEISDIGKLFRNHTNQTKETHVALVVNHSEKTRTEMSQLTFTCSKLGIESLEKGVKYVKS